MGGNPVELEEERAVRGRTERELGGRRGRRGLRGLRDRRDRHLAVVVLDLHEPLKSAWRDEERIDLPASDLRHVTRSHDPSGFYLATLHRVEAEHLDPSPRSKASLGGALTAYEHAMNGCATVSIVRGAALSAS